MNLNLTKDEFHELIMLYLVDMAQNEKELLKGEDIIHSPEFDDFLRHLTAKPLGRLRTVYFREDAKDKLHFRRLKIRMDDEETDKVRLMI